MNRAATESPIQSSHSSHCESLEQRFLLSAGVSPHHGSGAWTRLGAITAAQNARHPQLTRAVSAALSRIAAPAARSVIQPAARTTAPPPARPVTDLPPTTNGTANGQQPGAPNTLTFHGDAARTGFNQNETVLNQSNVAQHFGQVWQSPVLDGHLYASPLYVDTVGITSGASVQNAAFVGKTVGIVYAATGGASVYAIKAFDTNGPSGIAAGTVLWKTTLGTPSGSIDGNSIGVLSTPTIDLKSNRIYVTCSVTNPGGGNASWEVFALDIRNGAVITGFPLLVNQTVVQAINQNNLNGTGSTVLFGPNKDRKSVV